MGSATGGLQVGGLDPAKSGLPDFCFALCILCVYQVDGAETFPA